MKFCINSDLLTYEYADKSIYGELFFEFGNMYFPSKGWTDIISSVIDMWVINLIDLLQSTEDSNEYEFYFMDGSYYIKLVYLNEDIAKVVLYDDSKQINPIPYRISIYSLLTQISNIIINMNSIENNMKITKDINNNYKKLKSIAKYRGYDI